MKDPNLTQTAPAEVKWGGIINEFLWTFAGVNKALLRQCPNEYSKYAGMGGTILGTAIMAAISGAYAIYFVFEDILIASIFGVFWGTLILNLDRFIVSTMYSDGKHTVSWQELKSGLPRIIMAIFLGIVIATPLEMKLFEERINIQIDEIENERLRNYKFKDDTKLNELKLNKSEIEARKDQLDKRVRALQDSLMLEIGGYSLSGKAGEGPEARKKNQILNDTEESLDETKYELSELNIQIERLENYREQDRKSYETKAAENGFCQRYEAFAQIDDSNPELTMVIWFIRLLFIIIEVSPVFFRMMIATGSYDELLRANATYISKMAQRDSREITEEYDTEIAINTERNRIRLEAENQANRELYYGIAKAQSEVIATAIDNWKKKELEKVTKDPSSYIKIN